MLHRLLIRKSWFQIPVGFWLLSLLVFLLCAALFSILFVRREVVDYPMKHLFSVHDPAFFGSALSLSDPVPLEGNKIELLQNGEAIFASMLEAIRGARQSVNFEAFLFESGKVGSEFRDALAEKARSGLRVRVLLDGLGSGWKLDNHDVEIMQQAGCYFAYYHPAQSWRIDQLNRRSHRRVLVVDGRIGFTGGVGFADRWDGRADGPSQWRDVQARMEGPIVTQLQSAFQAHWVKSYHETLTGPKEFPALPAAGTIKAQVIASESFSFAPMALAQAVAFSSAEQSIFITNAYCTPSEEDVQRLVAAVRRGVAVKLLLPGKHNDEPATAAAGRTAYGDLLRGGVEIYEYQPTMIHNKTMVVDGLFATFGTSNFDTRSALINEELDVTVYDEGFGRQMDEVFAKDLEQSKRYTLQDFESRSWWARFSEWLMIPFHSQV